MAWTSGGVGRIAIAQWGYNLTLHPAVETAVNGLFSPSSKSGEPYNTVVFTGQRNIFATRCVIFIGMQPESLEQRFEKALTPAIYRGAWGFAARLCQNRENAEDLLQESLIKAFRSFEQLREADKFKPWLFSIIRSLFISSTRKKRLPSDDCYWLQFVATAKTEHPLSEMVSGAMFSLPEQQRMVLSLFYLDGMNLIEVGQVLGTSQRVVAQRLHRARHALRRKLDGALKLEALTQG